MAETHVDIPDWLNEDYVGKILTSWARKPVKVFDHQKEIATSKGENFVSALHRVDVDYQIGCENDENQFREKISLIVKSRIDNEIMEEIESDFNVFEREAQLYRIIMTSCEDLLKKIGDNTKFGPRPLYVDNKIIVQEDLKKQGYKIHDIREGLNYEQCRCVLEKLAKFHATTRILFEEKPDLFRYHMRGNVTETPTPLHDFYKNAISTCIEYMKTVPELQEYIEKLENFGQKIVDKVIKVFTRKSDGFNVLNHGDLWVNNLMFKEDPEGNIEDVLLVDYQEGYYGSPGIDFNYFIYSSWSRDIYPKMQNKLLKEYHSILEGTLNKLNYKGQIPSFENILSEVKAKAAHGLITATCLYPILINEHKSLTELEIFLCDTPETNEKRFIVFNNPKYGKFLEIALKDFIDDQI